MAVRLRLARVGKKNDPMFRIVATDSRKMTKSMGIENLGTYNPMTDEYVQFHVERIEDWLKKGAIPTDSVKKLYVRFKKKQALKQPESVVQAAPVQPEPRDVPAGDASVSDSPTAE